MLCCGRWLPSALSCSALAPFSFLLLTLPCTCASPLLLYIGLGPNLAPFFFCFSHLLCQNVFPTLGLLVCSPAGRPGAGSYIVEFDVPAYPGLYPSFLVFLPIPRPKGLRAFLKQLAATTNYTGNFTSSFGYLITGYRRQVTRVPVRPPAVCIRVSS